MDSYTVLVTGANGFIGSSLIESLIKQGYKVFGTVRKAKALVNSSGNSKNLIELNLESDNLYQDCVKLLPEVDCVVHLAGVAHNKNNSKAYVDKVNVEATKCIHAWSIYKNVKRFVYISSIGVNGNRSEKPFLEIDTPNPINFYTLSKQRAEHIIKQSSKNKIEFVIIRPPLVYGVNAPGNFKKLLDFARNGVPLPLRLVNNKRSLISIGNLVNFISLCVNINNSPKAKNQIFLVSDGRDISTYDLYRILLKSLNKSIWIPPFPVSIMKVVAKLFGKEEQSIGLFDSLQIDNSKAERVLGWNAAISIEEEMNKIVKEVLKNEKKI
jgi:nucleoside-diphosphate-sugar epimerase